jgi:hypothetical protein
VKWRGRDLIGGGVRGEEEREELVRLLLKVWSWFVTDGNWRGADGFGRRFTYSSKW